MKKTLLVLFTLVLTFSGCKNDKDANTLVGKWEYQRYTIHVTTGLGSTVDNSINEALSDELDNSPIVPFNSTSYIEFFNNQTYTTYIELLDGIEKDTGTWETQGGTLILDKTDKVNFSLDGNNMSFEYDAIEEFNREFDNFYGIVVKNVMIQVQFIRR